MNYMLNEKATKILLIVGLIKKTQYNRVNIFQNQNLLEQMQKLNQICLIVQQKQILKMQQVLIHQILLKRLIQEADLKSDLDKSDIDKLKNVPTSLRNLKSKVDKLDVYKAVLVTDDLSKVMQ